MTADVPLIRLKIIYSTRLWIKLAHEWSVAGSGIYSKDKIRLQRDLQQVCALVSGLICLQTLVQANVAGRKWKDLRKELENVNVSLLKAVFQSHKWTSIHLSCWERSPRARYFKTLANKIQTICTTRHTTENVTWVNWPFMISWTRPEQKPDINSSALQQQAPYLLLRVDNLRGSWTFDQHAASAGPQRQDEEVVGRLAANGNLLHLFPCAPPFRNLEAITAPSYLPSGEIWSELTL